jgi:hypothetical protein
MGSPRLVTGRRGSERRPDVAGIMTCGAEVLGEVGLVVGPFAPRCSPRPPSPRVGAPLTQFAKHRVQSRIENTLDETLPAGAATLVASYDDNDAEAVRKARSASGVWQLVSVSDT